MRTREHICPGCGASFYLNRGSFAFVMGTENKKALFCSEDCKVRVRSYDEPEFSYGERLEEGELLLLEDDVRQCPVCFGILFECRCFVVNDWEY